MARLYPRIIARDTYERLYRLGLLTLREELQKWNAKVSSSDPPYQNEVERITQMLEWFEERFRAGAFEARDNVSLETDRLLKAAGLLSIYLKERQISESRARKEPLRVIDAVRKDLFWMKERADLLKDVEPADVLWDVIPKQTSQPSNEDVQIPESVWDVFISHASEDKDPFVRYLAEALRSAGLSVWYDEFTLKLGDSLRESIDQGLAKSSYGVVVLSPAFFAKRWPQLELNGLVAREIAGRKVILPIWHDIDINEVRKYSPVLADRVAAKSSDGIQQVVNGILGAIT